MTSPMFNYQGVIPMLNPLCPYTCPTMLNFIEPIVQGYFYDWYFH